MNKYINAIQTVAFYSLVTFIFLIISLKFLEWAVKFSFWNSTLGTMYLSLNMFEKLIALWFLGLPLYLIKTMFDRK
jgi:hypothetical protein